LTQNLKDKLNNFRKIKDNNNNNYNIINRKNTSISLDDIQIKKKIINKNEIKSKINSSINNDNNNNINKSNFKQNLNPSKSNPNLNPNLNLNPNPNPNPNLNRNFYHNPNDASLNKPFINKTSSKDNKIYKISLPHNINLQKKTYSNTNNPNTLNYNNPILNPSNTHNININKNINNNKNNINLNNNNNSSKEKLNSNIMQNQNNKSNFNKAQVIQRNMHFQNANIFNSKIRQRENQNKKFDDLFRIDDGFIDEDENSDDKRYVKYLSSINRRLSHGIKCDNKNDSDSNSVVEANFEQIEKEEMYTARIGEQEDYFEELREKKKKKK
jgi:hypothetical protein